MTPSPWLTPEQAAEYHQISRDTLDRWINQGRLGDAVLRVALGSR